MKNPWMPTRAEIHKMMPTLRAVDKKYGTDAVVIVGFLFGMMIGAAMSSPALAKPKRRTRKPRRPAPGSLRIERAERKRGK